MNYRNPVPLLHTLGPSGLGQDPIAAPASNLPWYAQLATTLGKPITEAVGSRIAFGKTFPAFFSPYSGAQYPGAPYPGSTYLPQDFSSGFVPGSFGSFGSFGSGGSLMPLLLIGAVVLMAGRR